MISIKLMLDDLVGRRVIRGKDLIRQNQRVFYRSRPYNKEATVRGKYDSTQVSSPYYSRNYNHGQSTQKCSNGRNELFDRSRENNSKIYRRDYHHGSTVPPIDESISEKSDKPNCEFYRRNYFEPSLCERRQESCKQSTPQENLFLQSSDVRPRSLVDRSEEPQSRGNVVLRPSVLPTANKSTPRIQEIVSLSNPVMPNVAGSSQSTRSADVPDAAATEKSNEVCKKSRRNGRRFKNRRELAQMRKRIAGLSIRPKPTAETRKPSKSPEPRPSTSTTSSQTSDEPSILDNIAEKSIVGTYHCKNCHSFCLPELYECGAGHAVCEECWLRLSRCPGVHDNEHNAGSFRRALGLERIAKFLKFPCRWQENGCKEKLAPDDWKDHVARCNHLVSKSSSKESKVQPVLDSGLDSDDDVVVIFDDDEDYEFQSDEE